MSRSLIVFHLIAAMTFGFTRAADGQTSQPTTAPGTLRVTCFNIRYMNEKDGPDRWTARRDIFFEALTKGDPDLIGLQEVLHAQAEEIRAKLKGHDFVGVGRDDGKQAGEYVPILFKRDRFQKRDEGHFWLSETPEVVGSKGWDAQLPRIASWVKLADKQNDNRPLLFINAHFDHRGQTARQESAKLLRKKAEELAPSMPVIITGDFNTIEDGPAYASLVKPEGDRAPKLIDSYRAMHPQRSPEESTFSGFKGVRIGSRIDWILHTPDWRTLSAEIDTMNKDGRYPSDHYPVRAELKWVDGE